MFKPETSLPRFNNKRRTAAILLAGGIMTSSLTACGNESTSSAVRPPVKVAQILPQYLCKRITVAPTMGQPNSVKVEVEIHESGKSQFKGAAIDFHEGLDIVKSDALPGSNVSFPVSYQFTNPGKHTIDASAWFEVDGQMKKVTSPSCHTEVTVKNIFN